MSTEVLEADAVTDLLRSGLRNRWWCVGPSAMFRDKPVSLTRLGKKIVGWRGQDGKVRLVEDRCPHRGLKLSMGSVVNDDVACAYHGVRVDGGGVITAVPGMEVCGLVGRKLIDAYAVVEHFQGVWAYFGDEAHNEPAPFELPTELTSPEWTGMMAAMTWGGNYQYVYDNFVDMMHTRFLHEESYSMGVDAEQDSLKLESLPTGFKVTRRNDPTNIETMEFVDDGAMYARVGVSMPPALGPGGALRIIATSTPIDANRALCVFWRLRKIQGWQAAMYRFMFNSIYESFTWDVMEQDRLAVESMPPWPAQENLYQHDVGVVRVRRHFRAQAEKQIAELAAQ